MNKKRQDNFYWDNTIDEAIIEFRKISDKNKREKIFNEKIYPALKRLTEAIIKTYRFSISEQMYHEYYIDGLSFLYTRLFLFNENRGTKAYSFLGTALKNYYKAKKLYSKKVYSMQIEIESLNNEKSRISISEKESIDMPVIESVDYEDVSDKSKFLKLFISYVRSKKNEICETEIEENMLESILEILSVIKNTGLDNKRAFFILLKEKMGYYESPENNIFLKIKKLYNEFKFMYFNNENDFFEQETF